MDDKENVDEAFVGNIANDDGEKNKKDPNLMVEIMEPEPLTTKVYYFVDDQPMPYASEVPVPPSKITLQDFKPCVNRRSYKYYQKIMDPSLNTEVKAQIHDEYELLKPNPKGRFELFLLTENGPGVAAAVPHPFSQPQHFQQALMLQQAQARAARASIMAKRASAHYVSDTKMPYLVDNNRNTGPVYADFASSVSSSQEDDSQYTTTDFTSVSQQNPHNRAGYPHAPQMYGFGGDRNRAGGGGGGTGGGFLISNKRYDANNKPYWTREKRKRYRRHRSPQSSFMSSAIEDTEVSMAVELITVTFNFNTDSHKSFGLSIVVKHNRSFYGIVVHDITPNSLAALDGRVKPGYIVLEVNGIPLNEYETPDEAVNLLSSMVREAVENKYPLKLTFARGETPRPARNIFRPPVAEPVRPIDPTAWVQHTNAARGLVLNSGLSAFKSVPDMQKSATMPKTNPKMKNLANVAGQVDYNNQQQFAGVSPLKQQQPLLAQQFDQKMARAVQMKPCSTQITTTSSDHSSLECSIGQEIAGGAGRSKKKSAKGKGRHRGGFISGGIGSALRRLVCMLPPANPHHHSGNGGGRKRKVDKEGNNKQDNNGKDKENAGQGKKK